MEVRNRFKGLDLIDGVPEELWMEVYDIVQKAVINNIPKKKKCKKAKWLSEEAALWKEQAGSMVLAGRRTGILQPVEWATEPRAREMR